MDNPSQTFGLGAGHPVPENQPEVTREVHREWCKRRALYNLNKQGLGSFGNAYGQLYADLMRHEGTKDLLDGLKEVTTREQLEVFVNYL